MIFEPAKSCMTSPEVTIGLIPSSMHVPLHHSPWSQIGYMRCCRTDQRPRSHKAVSPLFVTLIFICASVRLVLQCVVAQHDQVQNDGAPIRQKAGSGQVAATISVLAGNNREEACPQRRQFEYCKFCLPVGSHDHSRPKERVLRRIGLDAIKRQLTADEKDKQRGRCVQSLDFERLPRLRLLHIRQDSQEGLD